ncbi:hypothetical protein E4U19_006774 [Claviceps sp. Clav32 group G5]|nr:hypothetical protein E4U19_006774 [Claviceps sp. Clav32 group G5]KAG6050402.1 hypothetical protein E4U39_004223 [Claviceps sp. Clav50 group G5]KAG6051492.1 hypothetical protein E4U17_006165 [Claviceps sp. LM77 group G4]KAG6063579.1 hypothetical protein E4U33_006326 [Claviceps sp. LM78 group G4]KAG6079122.1 hypothetical protein E4U16_001248 [Claviceps sp. LM84 group G4]
MPPKQWISEEDAARIRSLLAKGNKALAAASGVSTNENTKGQKSQNTQAAAPGSNSTKPPRK